MADYWYHLIPKDADPSTGIMSPYYMYHHGKKDMALQAVDKYRNRLVQSWGIYPHASPSRLTLENIMDGLNKFRGEYGTRSVYLFKYPPSETMGPNMRRILTKRCICRVDLDKLNLAYVDYTVNDAKGKAWFDKVSPFDYFNDYDDDAEKSGKLLFAGIPHIAVATESGLIPKRAVETYDIDLLYHGSSEKHTLLTPHQNLAYNRSLVYATPFYHNALVFAGKHWNDLEINQTFIDGKMHLTEIIPDMFRQKFDTPGYIHQIRSEGFFPIRDDSKNEYGSQWEVRPLKVDRIKNVLNHMYELEIKLYKYPKLPEFIPDRLEYIKKKCKDFNISYTGFINKFLP